MRPHSPKRPAPQWRSIIPQTPPPVRSWRAARVADWFGLPSGATSEAHSCTASGPTPDYIPAPVPGQILLLTGASGSGKSTLLRTIVNALPEAGFRPIDLAALTLPDVPVVDCLPELSIEAALLLLGRMGLGEAWTYLRTPSELSDGQRWRLRLALAVHESGRLATRGPVLICDEFAALLDRITATIVARSIRKIVNAFPRLSAVLATSHGDLIAALAPDRIIRCDFGVNEEE